jgi:hypothetical protein
MLKMEGKGNCLLRLANVFFCSYKLSIDQNTFDCDGQIMRALLGVGVVRLGRTDSAASTMVIGLERDQQQEGNVSCTT